MRLVKPQSQRMNSDKEKGEFGKRLREAMLDAGYAARGSAKSGVDSGALFRALYETKERGDSITPEMARRYVEGRAKPRDFRLKKIAEWLGVNFLWLRDGMGQKRGMAVEGLKDDEERKLIRVWREASADGRAYIMGAVDTEEKLIESRRKKRG